MLRAVFLSVLSGILLALTVYPIHWKFLSWVALVPLLVAIEKRKLWQAFLLGLVPPLVYFPVLTSWIALYRLRIFLVVWAIYLLAFAGVSAVTNFLVRRWEPQVRFWIPAGAWMLMEFLFSLTPLGSMGTHLETIQSVGALQILSISGEGPIVFLFLWVNGIVAYGILKKEKAAPSYLALALLTFLAIQVWGNAALESPPQGGIQVAVAQPNFPFGDKWRFEHKEEIFRTYREMAEEASREGAQVIVFPQYTIPEDVYLKPERMGEIAKRSKLYLLLGTYTPPDNRRGRYNIALVFSPEGKIIGEYRAVRPPPFRRIGQIRGEKVSVIETPLGKWGILLCYEDADPRVARKLAGQGAEILFSLMNDADFRRTKGLYLHFARDMLRAVETRRFLVRSAATGISAVIDPHGRVVRQTAVNEKALVFAQVAPSRPLGQVAPARGTTFFVKHGDLFTPLAALLTFALLIYSSASTPHPYPPPRGRRVRVGVMPRALKGRRSKEQQ